NGSIPASALGAPQVLDKPDIAATDCGVTTFFISFDGTNYRFCGTSAAAPHAAGVAALLKDLNGSATVSQIKNALINTAVPVGSFGQHDVGAGLIDANAAATAIGGPPSTHT